MAGVTRRRFVGVLGSAAACLAAAHGQQPQRMRRITVLRTADEDDPQSRTRFAAFREELQKLGWIEGRNVNVEIRYTSAGPDRIETIAAEIVAAVPDVIVTTSNQGGTIASRHTRIIPIVMAAAGDPSIIEAATRHRLPAVYYNRFLAIDGGLL